MKLKTFFGIIVSGLIVIGLTACTSESQLKDQMTKILKENPDIITDTIKKNPLKFVEAFQEAVKDAQGDMAKKREDEEQKKLEEAYDNPLQPKMSAQIAIRGDKNAPLLLVEYSDFECPFCTKGFTTVQELRQKYGKNIAFVYKHLPLSFHSQAMPAAQYFEAIRIQSVEKAYKFHDEIFENQRKLKNGETFLKAAAEKAGADMAKLAKDLKSKEVLDRIEEDQQEAASFGMQGTPGFLINGIPVKGAYPTSHFIGIVDELVKKGKVKL